MSQRTTSSLAACGRWLVALAVLGAALTLGRGELTASPYSPSVHDRGVGAANAVAPPLGDPCEPLVDDADDRAVVTALPVPRASRAAAVGASIPLPTSPRSSALRLLDAPKTSPPAH